MRTISIVIAPPTVAVAARSARSDRESDGSIHAVVAVKTAIGVANFHGSVQTFRSRSVHPFRAIRPLKTTARAKSATVTTAFGYGHTLPSGPSFLSRDEDGV